MTIWSHKKDKNGNWIVTRDDKKIIDVPNQALGEELELIFAELEQENLNQLINMKISMKAATQAAEFYQELIKITLEDKLSEIDNMYAMKKMLEETTKSFESLIERLQSLEKATNEVKNAGTRTSN